jgi:hypothetical protein
MTRTIGPVLVEEGFNPACKNCLHYWKCAAGPPVHPNFPVNWWARKIDLVPLRYCQDLILSAEIAWIYHRPGSRRVEEREGCVKYIVSARFRFPLQPDHLEFAENDIWNWD